MNRDAQRPRGRVLGQRTAWVLATVALLAVTSVGTAYSAGLITSDDIQDRTIRKVDLHSDSVTSPKIADGAVTSADILDGSITAADLAPGAVPTPTSGGSSVTNNYVASTVHTATWTVNYTTATGVGNPAPIVSTSKIPGGGRVRLVGVTFTPASITALEGLGCPEGGPYFSVSSQGSLDDNLAWINFSAYPLDYVFGWYDSPTTASDFALTLDASNCDVVDSDFPSYSVALALEWTDPPPTVSSTFN